MQELFAPVTRSSVQCLLPLKFTSPLKHCVSDCFRPRGHTLHAFVVPSVRPSGCAGVDCLRSSGNCRASSAWVSAHSFRGSPHCALTVTINVRASPSTLSLSHSMIVFMMSACASPASVVRGPLPIHRETLFKVVSLSHKYNRLIPGGVACSV